MAAIEQTDAQGMGTILNDDTGGVALTSAGTSANETQTFETEPGSEVPEP